MPPVPIRRLPPPLCLLQLFCCRFEPSYDAVQISLMDLCRCSGGNARPTRWFMNETRISRRRDQPSLGLSPTFSEVKLHLRTGTGGDRKGALLLAAIAFLLWDAAQGRCQLSKRCSSRNGV